MKKTKVKWTHQPFVMPAARDHEKKPAAANNRKAQKSVSRPEFMQRQRKFDEEFEAFLSMAEDSSEGHSAGDNKVGADITPQRLAIDQMHRLVTDAVHRMNELAMKDPGLFDFSPREAYWPVLYSEHPFITRRNMDLYRKLGVGTAFPWSHDQHSKSDLSDVVTDLAFALVDHISHARWITRSLRTVNLQLNECPQWVSDAKKLPPLSGTTAPAWWAVCKAALDEACPHIEERPEFDHINKGEAAYRRRAAIKDRLKRRIFSLLKK